MLFSSCGDIADPAPSVVLVSVENSELDAGKGDGNTVDDVEGVVAGTDDRSFQVGSARSGGGAGRTYTVTCMATDVSGNSATAGVKITVDHEKGK